MSTPVKVLEVVCEGDDVMDCHLGLHDVDLLLARGRQQVDLLHSRLMNTVEKGYRGIYELKCRNFTAEDSINLNTEPADVLDTRQCSCILLPQYRASLRPLTQFSGSLTCPWKHVEVSVIYRVSLTSPACETTQERNHPYRLGLRYLSQITFICVEVYTSQELYIQTKMNS